ncbi:hypothetical protein FS837_005259 [Tulasnella sp. UAMH 9824]|nr:hypothetical protein FS837_005259 [Tulasnella sp. UAMH 9824]
MTTNWKDWEAFLDGNASRKPQIQSQGAPSWNSSIANNLQPSAIPPTTYHLNDDEEFTSRFTIHSSASPPAYDAYDYYRDTFNPRGVAQESRQFFGSVPIKQAQVVQTNAWSRGTIHSGQASPVSTASSESSLAGALGQTVAVPSQHSLDMSPSPPTEDSGVSSLSGALIVPRTARQYQARPAAATHRPPHQLYPPQHISASQSPYYVSQSPIHNQATVPVSAQGFTAFHGMQQPHMHPSWSPPSAAQAQLMQESSERSFMGRSPASVDMALPPQSSSSQSLLHPVQQQTLAMATHIPASQQPTPTPTLLSSPSPMQSFSMHVQSQPGYSPPIYHVPPPAPSNPMLQHYLQQQQAMIHHQQYTYQQAGSAHSAMTPSSSAPSPGYWKAEDIASPAIEMDADGEGDGAGDSNNPDRTFSAVLNSPETFVHNASLAHDTHGVHLPLSAAPASNLPVPGSSRSGRLHGEDFEPRNDSGMSSTLPLGEASAARQTATTRKRAVPSNATKSSSRRAPGTFTFVGGPSKREAMLMQQQHRDDAGPSGSRKRASPNVGSDDDDGDFAEGSGRRTRRKTSALEEGGGEARTPSGLSAAFTAAYSHIHVTNIPCPHPECAFTADVNGSQLAQIYAAQGGKKKGKAVPKPYLCPYINPMTGEKCHSAFRRRGCRDRHGGSHSGRESKDVSEKRLNLGLARRLLWETARLIEANEWTSLYVDANRTQIRQSIEGVKAQMAAGEISSHQAAASVFLSKEEAQRRIELEVPDLDQLRDEAKLVKVEILSHEVTPETAATVGNGQSPAITPIDMDIFPLFSRVALQRAFTFERYFCPERNCDVDFTRLDALLRHSKHSHKDGKKARGSRRKASSEDAAGGSKGSKGRAAGKRKSAKGKARKDDSEMETDEEQDGWDSHKDDDSDDDMESESE